MSDPRHPSRNGSATPLPRALPAGPTADPNAQPSGGKSPAPGAAPSGVHQVRCPQCGKPAALQGNPWRPFCSERCGVLDRGAWASDQYGIPAREPPDADPDEE